MKINFRIASISLLLMNILPALGFGFAIPDTAFHWSRDAENPVPYCIPSKLDNIDTANGDTILPVKQWKRAIQASALTWNDVGANFTFSYYTKYTGIGLVIAKHLGDDAISATTNIYANISDPSIIVSAVTRFNLDNIYGFSTKPESNKVHVQSVMLHEFGHWLYLDNIYDSDSSWATMFITLKEGQVKDTLSYDDIAGIKWLYPFSAWVSCSTNITVNEETGADAPLEVVTGSSTLYETGTTNGSTWLWLGTLYDTPEITSLYTVAMCSYPTYGDSGNTYEDLFNEPEIEPLSKGSVTISVDGNILYTGSGIHYYRLANLGYYYNVVEIPDKAILDTIKDPRTVSIKWQTATWPSQITVGDSTLPLYVVENYYYPYTGLYQPLMAYRWTNLIEYDPSVLTTTIKKSSSFVTENEVDNYEVALDKIVSFKNYPNPFFDKTELSYVMPENSKTKHVTLKIYNILGQSVKTLVNEIQQTGKHTIIWDKQTDSGNKAQSGIYICRLQIGDYSNTQKVVILK